MKQIVCASLPKTGTSTLSVMLRVLNYKVTGPNSEYTLCLKDEFQAFQDYPWCSEYIQFDPENTLFIFLEREDYKWLNSFNASYGKNGKYDFMERWDNTFNIPQNKDYFLQKKKEHRDLFVKWAKKNNAETLFIDIKDLTWDILCDFTSQEIPKNIFGKTLEVPKINSGASRKFIMKKKLIKKIVFSIIEPKRVSYLRNGVFRLLGKRI